MVKKTSRGTAAKSAGPAKTWAARAKSAEKKERVGFTEFDEGTYVFQLKDMTYGTRTNKDKEVFFSKSAFVTGEYKGQVSSIGWNVDAKKTFGEGLTNFDLFYWFLEEVGCIPPEFDPEKVCAKVKKTQPYYKANLTKFKSDQGGVFYSVKYAKKLSKAEVAAL